MFPSIFLLFIAMPIIEIFVLIQVGSAIGALATIAIVIFTAILGTWMLRSQGLSTLNRARNRLSGGEIPAFQLMEGIALAVGGALLLTPGFVTDAIGFACLLPPTRHLLVKAVSRRVSFAGMAAGAASGSWSQQSSGQSSGQSTGSGAQRPKAKRPPDSGDVIEGEYTRKD